MHFGHGGSRLEVVGAKLGTAQPFRYKERFAS
jgi:hypothetical protein